MEGLIHFELEILNGIQNIFSSEIGNYFWSFITHLGDMGIIWIIFTICLLIYPKTRKIGVICAISLMCSFIITNLFLKNMFERIRPFNYTNIQLLIKKPLDYSFPSGHTSISFAFVFVVIKEKLKIKKINLYIPALILGILIAFSRLYLYVHFPTDILGGILVGYVCSIIAFKISKILFKKINI
ncbi:phosphatase PAP2 family protein [uncultured Clostridium sp.]|uniref:phosphatase PAP2 family protein n=1 Tax=uncultured Clostridium sp. TaxID=59620 RepID=UPI002631A842|nr:phosphatase PAP2 family protein [uncultured Clostridium sp.]